MFSKSDKIYLNAGKLILILAFMYILLRAYDLSITYDEALTYIWYATRSYIGIFTEPSLANNHFLNTVLIKFFTSIFGVSEFVVRIPALIGASMYLTACYYISKFLFKGGYFIVALILLFGNALIMDFLPLARGYSLALGFFMIALYYLLKGEHNEIVILMCTLSVLSSLSFLYVYGAFILLNTPQLCCGDEHETDLRLMRVSGRDDRITACKSLCLSNKVSHGVLCQI